MMSETAIEEIKQLTSTPQKPETCSDHRQHQLAIQDTMAVLGGKWRIQVLTALAFNGKRRFSELLKDVEGIGPKMLSKELYDLETNQLVIRTVKNTKPMTVEYQMTRYGHSIGKVIKEIVSWGTAHRERIMKGDQDAAIQEPAERSEFRDC